MVTYPDEKAAVDELIETLGTDVDLATLNTESYDEDNGWSEGYNTSTSIKAAVYNNFVSLYDLKMFGNVELGSTNLVVKGDQTISEKDKITYNSTNYFVTSVNPLPIGETTLAKIVVLSEKL